MKKILQTLRENINAQITALASATGKEVESLRAGLQAQLLGLAELDKLPESDSHTAFLPVLQKLNEHASAVFNDMQALRTQLATATQSLTDLQGKITAGDYVEKAKVEERCDLAKDAARKELAPEIAELRKKVIAKLPEPPANILALPTTDFNSAIADAEANLAAAAELGLSLEGTGAKFLKRALFTKKDAFATELAELQDAGLTGDPGDPLKGGKKDDDVPVVGQRKKVRLC